ncbi:MAG: RDD family protein [Acidimicrobiales bacterium]
MTSPPAELEAHQGQRAGLVSRFLADAVDLMVIVAAVGVAYFAVGAFRFVVHEGRFRWPVPGAATVSTLAWILLVFYLALGWSGTGRTVGKQVLGLRVVDRHGRRVRFGTALVRSLLSVLVPVGLLWCAISRERRSLADEVLRTSVLYDWHHRIPPHA